MLSHKYYMGCKRCNGDMVPQIEEGLIYGLECELCGKHEIITYLTYGEYEKVLIEYLKAEETAEINERGQHERYNFEVQ